MREFIHQFMERGWSLFEATDQVNRYEVKALVSDIFGRLLLQKSAEQRCLPRCLFPAAKMASSADGDSTLQQAPLLLSRAWLDMIIDENYAAWDERSKASKNRKKKKKTIQEAPSSSSRASPLQEGATPISARESESFAEEEKDGCADAFPPPFPVLREEANGEGSLDRDDREGKGEYEEE